MNTYLRHQPGAAPNQPTYRWPNGAHLAIYICLGVEEYRPEGGRVEDILDGGPSAGLANTSWRDYGNRVGGQRLLDQLIPAGIRPTVLLNTMAYQTAGPLIDSARQAGAELAAHGVSNSDSVAGMSPGQERDYIARVVERMEQVEGARPRSWSPPWLELNQQSVGLLAQAGIDYLLGLRPDDRPVELEGGLLAIPYGIELNDSTTMVGRASPPHHFARMVLDELEVLLEAAGREGPLVMNLALHSFISGAPFRLAALKPVFRHLAGLGADVWLATAAEIGDHHRAMVAAAT
jgi:peptidoglycan/xylan/chitin deacetylase (PgdA/CDA1 family)